MIKTRQSVSGPKSLTVVVYGYAGTGKTSLALTSGARPLLLDYDDGAYRSHWGLSGDQVVEVSGTPWLELKRELPAYVASRGFDSIVVDTVGKLQTSLKDYLVDVQGCYNKYGTFTLQGWGALKRELQEFLNKMKHSGVHVVFTAHEKAPTEEGEKARPLIEGSAGATFAADVDMILACTTAGSEYHVWGAPNRTHYVKGPHLLHQTDAHGIKPIVVDPTDRYALLNLIRKAQAFYAKDAEVRSARREVAEAIDACTDAASLAASQALIGKLAEQEQRAFKTALLDKAQSLGFVYNRENKQWEKESND